MKKNNYIKGAQTWKFKIGDLKYSVISYLYTYQNSQTDCCVYVALRTAAARFHPKKHNLFGDESGCRNQPPKQIRLG